MSVLAAVPWGMIALTGRHALRWLSLHTGLPVLIVAAVLLAVGHRLLRKTARFAVEVALVSALLLAATEAGWIRW
ncbi:MAG: hypothetical protein KF819_01475 [Labilithrix sp.]|nr:hypothetical protein [Labilithrix sp.]